MGFGKVNAGAIARPANPIATSGVSRETSTCSAGSAKSSDCHDYAPHVHGAASRPTATMPVAITVPVP